MRGSIRKRGSTYSIVLYMGRDEDGKRKDKWISGFRTKKEAETELNMRLKDLMIGTYFEPDKQNIAQYLLSWIDTHSANLAYNTARNYKRYINNRIIPEIGDIPLAALKPQQLQKFYSELLKKKLSPSTVLYIHRILHKALKQAVLWQNIHSNPADAVQPPKKNKFNVNLPNPDIIAMMLLESEGHILNFAIHLGILTGARRGELCALKWPDWNEDTL